MDKGTQGKILSEAGISVYEIGLKKGTKFVSGIRKLRKTSKKINPDVIHGWMYHGALFSLMSGVKAPKIMAIRHSLDDIKKDKPLTRLVIKLLAFLSKRFDAVIYNSITSRSQHEAAGYCSSQSVVIPNGFDTNAFSPSNDFRLQFRKENNIPASAIVFGNVARYHHIKNHHGLIEAFALFLRERPGAYLILAGQGVDDNNAEITEATDKHGIGDNVLLMGERKDIPDLLNALDAYVSASMGEAFPNVIGEAMSCGIPCIATAVGDTAAIIKDTGLLVPSGSSHSLAEALGRFALIPNDERVSLGKKARQRILENYQQKEYAALHEELYRRLAVKKQ